VRVPHFSAQGRKVGKIKHPHLLRRCGAPAADLRLPQNQPRFVPGPFFGQCRWSKRSDGYDDRLRATGALPTCRGDFRW
jgi:hypothetical protein